MGVETSGRGDIALPACSGGDGAWRNSAPPPSCRRGGKELAELPNPEVFEHWEENVKAWREVQAVFDWIRGDRDLYDTLVKIHRGEVTLREGFAQYEAVLVKRGELPAPIGP